MKHLIWILSVWTVLADCHQGELLAAPGYPASQQQVNAGQDTYAWVTSKTLAGRLGGTNVQGTVLHMGLVDSPGRVPTALAGSAGNVSAWGFEHAVAKFPMTNILVVLPNWYGLNETGSGGTITAAFSVEYPIGTTISSALFMGTNGAGYLGLDSSRTNLLATITNGQDTAGQICVTNGIPTGATYIYHWWMTNTVANGAISAAHQCRLDDACTFGTGLTNNTQTFASVAGASGASSSPGFYDPVFMAALTTQPTVLLLGASRESGVGDLNDTNVWNRYGQQRLYTQHSCAQVGIGGCGSQSYLTHGTNRLSAAQFAQIVVIGGVPINDVETFSLNPIATVSKLAALFTNVPVYCETAIPKPSSTDGFATIVNQTADTAMQAFNSALMSGVVTNISGAINVNSPVETCFNSGLYQVNGITNSLGGDCAWYGRIAAAFGGDPLSMGDGYGTSVQGGQTRWSDGSTNNFTYINSTAVATSYAIQACPLASVLLPKSPTTCTNAWTLWNNPTNGNVYLVAPNPSGGYWYSKLNGTITTTP